MSQSAIPYLLKIRAGEDACREGEALFGAGNVRITSQNARMIRLTVMDEGRYEVTVTPEGLPRCGCEDCSLRGACRHTVAAALSVTQSGAADEMLRLNAVNSAPALMGAMESALPEDGAVHLEVNLIVSQHQEDEKLKIGLRMGEDRMYVVRSIPQMISAMETGEVIQYGKGFAFHPEWMHFSPAARQIVQILKEMCLTQKEAGCTLKPADQRVMPLPEPMAERILRCLNEMPFRLTIDGNTSAVRCVREARIPLHFRVSSDLRGLTVQALFPRDFRPLTPSCSYAMAGGNVICVAEDQRSVMRVLWQKQFMGRCQFDFPVRDAARVIGELIPFLKLTGVVELSPELQKQLIRLPLVPKIYLDRAGRDVVARAQFCYGDREIDPFDETPMPESIRRGEKLLLRDAAAERKVLDALGASGFFVSRGMVYLSGQEAIFDFMTEGLPRLQEMCEVYLSNDFRRLAPRKPNLSGAMKVSGGQLELTFDADGEPTQEILAMMEALSRRRRYFRLKDGSFLDLSGLEQWQPLADAVTEAASLEGASAAGDTITLQAYRTAYLSGLLEGSDLPVHRDASVETTVRALTEAPADTVQLPQGLSLRPYQQRGYQWLSTLDRLHMGGVLADDMGLGKTVQVIALFKANREAGQTSLVVSPTTLTYNWLSELERFAPELSVMVISGSAAQRASQIRHVKEAHDVDVLITSYPLIRQDIDLMTDINFRFIVLDEAQHIKNAGSKAAVAVKQLKGRTRFALTGTPMENGVGELWSIFDFVLPGYLLGYSAFLRRYQDGMDAEDLRKRIRPFLMRRLKKDVLTELPDKIEHTFTAQMTPEQTKVYRAAMLRLRDRVSEVLAEKGFDRSRTEVLAAITQLRQICCHPQLVLEDYIGSSGKYDLLLDLLTAARASSRRVLLFSAFTSMLKILRRQLTEAGFTVMYLDGDTPAQERLSLTERFNGGAADVFLISLKAGGTGLNLTGADMVIHYDPWWNPAAEDQATDRAYRIGQTRKVDVIRLVTHGSIEEQVVALGQRKKALFDQLITPGEQMVTGLSTQEILQLFQ
ncbi:MAG: hypothetical protein E7333_08070 [Clostridiales bacterium]|nr:hypothetical protein [Clostridiales bacterium]